MPQEEDAIKVMVILDYSVSVIGCNWMPVETCKNREVIITFT